MIYLQLFWSMFKVGLLSFGGGYASIPLIREQTVNLHGWLAESEFMDIIAIAEMTPGPAAINSATFAGIKTAGIPGALVATLGCATPSCLIVLLLAKLYYKYRGLFVMQGVLYGLRPAFVAMIASVGVTILLSALFADGFPPRGVKDADFVSAGVFAIGLLMQRKLKLNPIYVIGGAGLIGLLEYALQSVNQANAGII